ncbi:hypothetical protein D3C72_751140 [compost metagenome]
MNRDDVAVCILVGADAFNYITVTQAYFVAGEEAEVAFAWHFHEVFLFYPQFFADRESTVAAFRVVRVYRCRTFDGFAFREVVDDEFERAQDGDGAGRFFIEVVAQCTFQCAHVDPAVDLGNADAFSEELDRFRCVATTTDTDDGRHARIIPAVDDFFFYQLQQFALAGDRVGQVEACEFVLMRQRLAEEAAFSCALQYPVIEGTVILEFQGADRVRDVFDRVFQRMRVVVHRVDTPFVASAMVVRVTDAVDRRVAQVHVWRGHVDLGAQDVFAILEFASLHATEHVQRFSGRTVAEG